MIHTFCNLEASRSSRGMARFTNPVGCILGLLLLLVIILLLPQLIWAQSQDEKKDVKAAHRLQDKVSVKQADIGKFEVPNWNKEEVEKMRATINVVAATVTDAGKIFGKKENLDPVYWLLGAALGWGGLPAEAASYVNVVPEKNDGKTAYTLTAKDVPVNAFWSVTLYDDEGWIPVNKYKAYSYNNVTAKKDKV